MIVLDLGDRDRLLRNRRARLYGQALEINHALMGFREPLAKL
jgi:hypothetical protein